jgi:hypothetical protein
MAVVTWDGSSSTAYSTAANWDTGSVPADGDDVIIPDTSGGSINACNVDSNDSCNSLTVLANGEIGSNAGAKLFILGEADGTGATTDGYAVNIGGIITDNTTTSLDLDIRTEAATNVDLVPSSGSTIRNLTINHASAVVNLRSAHTTLSGNLTIAAGQLDTYNSGSNINLTVTKHIDVTGTLTGNASAISTGTMTIRDGATLTSAGTITVTGEDVANSPSGANWLWRQLEDDGTGFAPTAGTVHFNHASNLNGKHINESKFYNLTLTAGTGHDVAWTPKTADTLTVSKDLTIVEGQLKRNVEANTLVVTEDVSIESGGVLGDNDETGPNTFGSLTIASGGTYKATSGTTTITSMTSTGSGDRSLSLVSGGTFTNNSGTVLFNGGADQRLQMAGTGNLYNLTVNKADNEFVTFGNLTILNNLDVTLAADHTWRPNATSDTLTVHGNTYLTTGRINNGSTQYAGINNWGNVTINSGEFVLSSGTNNFTGIRNVGGTVSQS